MNTITDNDIIDIKKESVNNLLKSNEDKHIIINNNDFSSVKKNIVQELEKKHKLALDKKFKESVFYNPEKKQNFLFVLL